MSAKQVVPDRIISAHASCGAERDEIRADELALDRHHVAHEPDVEAQVVGQTAQQRHRRMRVGVDEAGHDDAPAAVDALDWLEIAGDVADGEDRVAAMAIEPGRERELLVHRHDEGVGEEQVAGPSHDSASRRGFQPIL